MLVKPLSLVKQFAIVLSLFKYNVVFQSHGNFIVRYASHPELYTHTQYKTVLLQCRITALDLIPLTSVNVEECVKNCTDIMDTYNEHICGSVYMEKFNIYFKILGLILC